VIIDVKVASDLVPLAIASSLSNLDAPSWLLISRIPLS
jgi:hypothetical protein